MSRMTKWQRIAKARVMGCRMPIRAYRAGEEAHIPFWAICAFLEQETGGGRNVFGQDPTIYARAGLVTEKKYRAYRDMRHRTGQVQGVGPMQLTYGGYQDWADREGGCWKPYVNILVGAKILKGFLQDSGGSWYTTARKYNGSDAYAHEIWPKITRWRAAFEGK